MALELAVVVITQKQLSFDQYLREFEDVWADLLRPGRTTGSRRARAGAGDVQLRQALSSQSPAGAELLNLLAFFAAEGFQRAWLTGGERMLVDPLATTVREAGFLREALEGLARFSMIDLAGGPVTIDETVASFIRASTHEQYAEHAEPGPAADGQLVPLRQQ